MPRNYRKEYDDYYGRKGSTQAQRTSLQNQHRREKTNRNQARSTMKKKGRVRVGDGKDVDHINGRALDNNVKNLRIQSVKTNRSRNKKNSKHK